jgi:Ig-like domain from next to BRCA1 gene
MNSRRLAILIPVLTGLFWMSACGSPPPPTLNLEATHLSGTIGVIQSTQDYLLTLVAVTSTISHIQPTDTATPIPPSRTPTSVPPTSSATPVPPTPTPSPTPIPCDWAQFVSDISIKDGDRVFTGATFTKTWRLRNAGKCAWTTGYALVFVSGSQMGGPDVLYLPGIVRPGETIDLSIYLTAPDKEGFYTGYWELRNAANVLFGIGPQADAPFWVKIAVANKPPAMILDLSDNYCVAQWNSSNTPVLPCPGSETDIKTGFVDWYINPVLEDNTTSQHPALVTYPNTGSGGYIAGRYPPFKIQAGDHFRGTIGCLFDSVGCNVLFQLNYIADGGPVQNLGSWNQTYDSKYQNIDIDLTSLDGESVEFILVVVNNGDNTNDWAFWLQPRVIR